MRRVRTKQSIEKCLHVTTVNIAMGISFYETIENV
jgi:hypothetical protein